LFQNSVNLFSLLCFSKKSIQVDKNIIDYRNTLKKATRDVPRADLGLQDRVLVPDVIDDGFDFFMTSQGKTT
jgi:hypothetical protein